MLLAEKLTAAGGVPVVAQVYVRFDSPPPSLSAPSTESAVVVLVTGLDAAAAGVATVGWASVIVTDAVLLVIPPLPAVTPAVPDA